MHIVSIIVLREFALLKRRFFGVTCTMSILCVMGRDVGFQI